ncbi:polymorphic toxin type 30 domain-containing protein [Streptomyces hirsutus]|uniref:polymorphic toxin type 30 domain-containing protein n=1 Tax=Streptomyces hirsutus TaxID=35620 RepID=UPI00344733CF
MGGGFRRPHDGLRGLRGCRGPFGGLTVASRDGEELRRPGAPVSGVSVAGARGSPFIAVTSRADRSPCLRAHDIYRISIGGKYQDEAGNRCHRQVHNPNGPHYNPDAAHATHIPWLAAHFPLPS